MQAIILNSGVGRRLGDLTTDKPKCMINIGNNVSILQHQLQQLSHADIKEIIITTGPFEELIKEESQKYSALNIQCINNALYDRTNYIYSLYLIKDHIKEDILLLHGDLVFEQNILSAILNADVQDGVIINKNIPLPEKDFKGAIENNLVKEIGIHVFGPKAYPLFPIYKLTRHSFMEWMKEIERFVHRGEVNVYAENALNNLLSTDIRLNPVYIDGLCTEIDDMYDLNRVIEIFKTLND